MKNFTDLVGSVIGKLRIIRLLDGRPPKYLCECECGTEIVRSRSYLQPRKDRPTTYKSCGCWRKLINKEQMKTIHTTHNVSTWKLTPATRKLVEENYRLIGFVLRRYTFPEGREDEMRSAAHQALCSAAHHWQEYDKEIAFSTFAVKRIWSAMNKSAKPIPSLLLPQRSRREHSLIKSIRNRYYLLTGRKLQDEHIAKLTGISVMDIREMDTASYSPLDLDEVVQVNNGGAMTLGDLIPDEKQLSPLRVLEIQEEAENSKNTPEAKARRKMNRLKRQIAKLDSEINEYAGAFRN